MQIRTLQDVENFHLPFSNTIKTIVPFVSVFFNVNFLYQINTMTAASASRAIRPAIPATVPRKKPVYPALVRWSCRALNVSANVIKDSTTKKTFKSANHVYTHAPDASLKRIVPNARSDYRWVFCRDIFLDSFISHFYAWQLYLRFYCSFKVENVERPAHWDTTAIKAFA